MITLACFFGGVALVYGSPPDREPKLPSPIEIRDYQPQPNRLMMVEYSNGRRYKLDSAPIMVNKWAMWDD